MTMDDADDKMIDQLLRDVADGTPPPVSSGLMATIASDAASLHEGEEPQPIEQPGGFRGLWSALGGWPAMGSLVAAGVAGLWIGVSPATGVEGFVADVLGDDLSVDLFAGADVLSWEIEG